MLSYQIRQSIAVLKWSVEIFPVFRFFVTRLNIEPPVWLNTTNGIPASLLSQAYGLLWRVDHYGYAHLTAIRCAGYY